MGLGIQLQASNQNTTDSQPCYWQRSVGRRRIMQRSAAGRINSLVQEHTLLDWPASATLFFHQLKEMHSQLV